METLVAVKGRFALLVFDELGAVSRVVQFGVARSGPDAPMNCGVEISPEDWHTVIAIEPGSVLLEVKPGPFAPNVAKEFAAWAPDESSPEASKYFHQLRRFAIKERGQ